MSKELKKVFDLAMKHFKKCYRQCKALRSTVGKARIAYRKFAELHFALGMEKVWYQTEHTRVVEMEGLIAGSDKSKLLSSEREEENYQLVLQCRGAEEDTDSVRANKCQMSGAFARIVARVKLLDDDDSESSKSVPPVELLRGPSGEENEHLILNLPSVSDHEEIREVKAIPEIAREPSERQDDEQRNPK